LPGLHGDGKRFSAPDRGMGGRIMASASYQCPAGTIEMVASGGKLMAVRLGRRAKGENAPAAGTRVPAGMRVFIRYLDAYFERRAEGFDLSMVNLRGATDFQRRVYGALARVGFGRIISYGELAGLAGFEGGARAVGRCMGVNPTPIFIPCHRVVRAEGRLGGFGAGLEWKRWLLRHEGWRVKGDRIVKHVQDFSTRSLQRFT